MAHIMTKRGNLDNIVTYEHMCDYYSDLQNISMDERTLGSVALVLRGQSGGVEIYMTDSNKQWVPLSVGNGNGGTNNNSGSSEFIKYVNELPTEDIDAGLIYILRDENNNYTQWVYVDDAWQNLGVTTPEDINKVTLNIRNGTGGGSVVEGLSERTVVDDQGNTITENVANIASGALSHAEGRESIAKGSMCHAEGLKTIADGIASHTEGASTQTGASSRYAHAQGNRSVSTNSASHAEGNACYAMAANSHAQNKYTRALAPNSHVEGGGTVSIPSERYTHISGVNNALDAAPPTDTTEHNVGKKKITVRSHILSSALTYMEPTGKTPYYVDTDFEGDEFYDTLFLGKYAEVVGNGVDDNQRSNARTLDWDGNSWIAGNNTAEGNVIAKGGSLTLGTGANAVTITAAQLQQLLALLN